MQRKRFNETVNNQFNRCLHVLDRKGDEYVFGTDRLEFCKNTAREQDITPKQALWGMASKHITSIGGMCKNGSMSMPLWNEKITDSINYLLLLKALVEEEAENG